MTSSNPAPGGATQPSAWGAGAPTERRLKGVALFSVLGALMLTLLLEALDQTVVGTALPKIIAELNGFSLYTWVATAYLIASALVIPIVGKLSDQFGRKGFFIVGVVVFLLGSALSGAAQTIQALIAFRALQGLGAGIGISLVFTVVGDIFPPAERAKWQGIFGAVYGISSVFGPTLGGFLSDHGPLVGTFITDQSRWRWVFYVNIPIGLVALAALIVYLPTNLSARTSQYRGWAAIRRIDFVGAIVAALATISLLLGLTWGGQDYPWDSAQVIGALVVAAVLFVAFYFVERQAVEPVLPFSLFKNRVFTSVCLLSLGVGATILSLAIYLPLFMQGVLGESATNSGEVITPLTVSIVIGSVASGLLVARSGRYQWLTIIGASLITVGTFLLSRMNGSTSIPTAAIFMVMAGLGLGMFFSILTLAVQNSIPRTMMGVGTGATRYLQQAGSTLGVAIVGTVVNNTISSNIVLPPGAQQLGSQGLAAATNPQILSSADSRAALIAQAQHFGGQAGVQLVEKVLDALRNALGVGIAHGIFVVTLVGLGMLVTTFFLKDVPLAKSFQEHNARAAATHPGAPSDQGAVQVGG